MKAESAGNNQKVLELPAVKNAGFSTLELMIAFAILSIVLVGAIGANFAAQYWGITAQTSNEALYKAKTKLEDLRSLIKQDFYQAVSSPLTASTNASDPEDASCIAGGLCYYVQTIITDLSSCSKYVEAKVSWHVDNYPETTTKLFTYLTNSPEVIARGGDCILNQPAGDWENNAPEDVGSLSFAPGKQFAGIDVLHKKIYVATGTTPSFLIYNVPTSIGQSPTLAGSYDLKINALSVKLNAVDVEEDLSTGRTYAFATIHSNISQLAVIDVTDESNPSLSAVRSLQNVDPLGSFPQGWRLFIYGSRLYMTTRETTGSEFHIFDISTPTLPVEIGTGFELNRTVNDLVVREQKVGGITKRLVFLAADSNIKELGVLNVTNDSVTEINSLDLSGTQDGLSLSLLGNNLYFGRASNTSGVELYVFDVADPSASLTSHIIGQGEIGADVTNIEASGSYAYIGAAKSGEEFQVWNSDFTSWNSSILNSGRFKKYSFANLAPLGFEIDRNWIYGISSSSGGDKIKTIYAQE